MKVKDIMFEQGDWWVGRHKDCYTIYKIGVTHSVSQESFPLTADGLSIAIYYCQYLAKTINRMSTKDCLDLAKNLH